MSTATLPRRAKSRFKVSTLPKPYGPRDAGVPLTLDEFERADFIEGWRYELLGGVLVVNPPPLEAERSGNEILGHLLLNYQEQHSLGKSLDLSLPEQNIRTKSQNRRADRAIWAGLGRIPRTRCRPADRDTPTILVEFPSSRPADQRRDYIEKQREYKALGVREYWLIDRFRRTMTAFVRRGNGWTKKLLVEDETYRTPLLPGFELPLKRLFSRMDVFGDDEDDSLYLDD